MGIKLPVTPGHATADELLAFFMNPTTDFGFTNHTIGGTSFTITPRAGRRTVIIWLNNVPSGAGLWVNFGGAPAAIGTGVKLLGGAFGIDVADSKPISVIAEGGSIDICVVQFGGGE